MAKGAPAKPANLKSTEKPRGQHGGPRPNSGRTSKAAMMGVQDLLDRNWPQARRDRTVLFLADLIEDEDADPKLRLEAAKMLFNYTFGRPKEVKEYSGIDGAAIKHEVFIHRYDKQIDPE